MGLNGEKMLQNLKRLSQVDKMKQVEPLSYALFPGYHCPLMGAMLTIRAIKDSVMLVLGPDECAYYTKMATSGNGSMSADGCQIVSVVLEQHDVTFGCQEKLEEAMKELNEEYHPKAVFIVTTCVPEITGDDVESMADLFSDQYGFPVMVVHAENFKTDDHLPGIEHTLEVCCEMMQPQEKTNCVNVLGLRLGDFTKTEAAVNLVVHPVGLSLAKKMKKKFGTPYVVFERYSDPDRIYHAYKELFEILEKQMPEKLSDWHQKAKERTENAKPILKGKTYFSGNTALCNYELHSFLTSLGMEPLLLQISDLTAQDEQWRKEILTHCDPYVTRAANIGPLQYLYPVLKPQFNIGAGNAKEMKKSGTQMIRMMQAYNVLGFEVNEMVVNAFVQAQKGGMK